MSILVPPPLSVLVTPTDQPSALALELSIAQQLTLPVTAWQPVGVFRTLFAIQSYIIATYSITVASLAQGGYASYAAQMVDGNGNPITSWMDLIGVENYNVARIPASSASGPVKLDNSSATSYPFSPDSPLHFQYPVTGATFTSTGTGALLASTSNQSVDVQADAAWIGLAGTVPSGAILALLTQLAGVTVQPQAVTLAGFDAETNPHYLGRCQAKLGSLSPNGPALAYQYVVESIPQFGSILPDGSTFSKPTSSQPWGVNTPINRAQPILNYGSGIVDVYAANVNGSVEGCSDLAITNITWSTGTATVTTASAHDLSIGDWIVISGVKGATGVNNQVAGTPAWQCITASGSTLTFAPASDPGSYTSGGLVNGGDLGMATVAIRTQVVGIGKTAVVFSATTHGIGIAGTVYILTTAGIPGVTAINAIESKLDEYFASVPIGGINAESNGIVPWSEILTVIATANRGTVSVVLTSPLTDVGLTGSDVPVRGTTNLAIAYV